jgi:TonB family protein
LKTLFPLILVLLACGELLAGNPKRILVGRPRIEYPDLAKRQRLSGSGIYLLHVDAAGNVTSADVTKSAGLILDDAAIQSFKENFKYKPGTAAKVPVTVTWDAPGRAWTDRRP